MSTFALQAAVFKAVVPKDGPPPIGPFSPGILAGNYLYVSGQGAKGPDGQMPSSFEEQAERTLLNVESVLKAAGLTMDNVVYTQVYLDDMSHYEPMNKVYARHFGPIPPARATLGVAKLPGNTPIEINAVAIRQAKEKKAVTVPGYPAELPVSAGILTKERLFISSLEGRKGAGASANEVEAALDDMRDVVNAAGLTMANVVFVNPYLTADVPMKGMNQAYAKRFEFGNTPARATIEVASLPEQRSVVFTGVAVRDLKQRHAVRPKNMPPSPTASPCVFAGDTFYCSAKGGFIPGPNSGIFVGTVDQQLRQTMRNLLDNLEEAGLTFADVVSTNVYLDDVSDFALMNGIYAKYFGSPAPARTTIQQVASAAARAKKDDDTYPELEQISVVAVKAGSSQ